MIALLGGWLWAIMTLAAATAQTARNAMQRDLIGAIGADGATYVRFLFALPFTIFLVLVLIFGFGMAFPAFSPAAISWTFAGAATQIIATGLMLAGMKLRSFSVIVAFIKTEPVIIAILGLVVLGETLSVAVGSAIVIATTGVMLMSLPKDWPKVSEKGSHDDGSVARDWRPAVFGLGGGLFFALSAVSYRAALLTLETPSIVMAAASMQMIGQLMQAGAIFLWLCLFDRNLLLGISRVWRQSLFAGFMGALASLFWFMAFALTSAAKVRTLALVEVPMAMVVSRSIFKQGASARDYLGMALIVAGIVLLLNG